RITKQTEFSYMIGEYRDAKKKLTNFEKSILQPRGLSLADDLDMVKDQMNTEADAIKEKIAAMNNPENIHRRTEQIRKDLEEVERKRKSIDGRVNDFASLNDKYLSEKMEYETKQAAKVKDFKDVKAKDRKKKLAKAKAAQQKQRLR
ncbi:unnamed protein product, partial [marine sediment metagenome]